MCVGLSANLPAGQPGRVPPPYYIGGSVIDPAIFDGDPPMRPDLLCVVCLKDRKPERSQRYARGIADLDPFCSSTCSRAWHENPLPDRSIWGRPRRLEHGEAA